MAALYFYQYIQRHKLGEAELLDLDYAFHSLRSACVIEDPRKKPG
jgi:hypothetical protein